MYILLDKKKLTVLAENADPNEFTLYIKPDFGMDEIYGLFENNSLNKIIIYNDDETMYAVYTGYTTIDRFVFMSIEKQYVINLTKCCVNDLQKMLDECIEKVDTLQQNFSTIQNEEILKQSEYALQTLVSTFTDEQALNCALLFPEWDGNGVSYKKDERHRYGDKLFKVLQNHISQADWTPDSTPSLYVEVSDPAVEYPEWKQPTGSHNAYSKGDKVAYEGKRYISQIDSNTTVPGTDERWWKLVE